MLLSAVTDEIKLFSPIFTSKYSFTRETVLMMELIKDLLGFLVERKKLWMAPIILVLLLFGSLIVLTEGSAVAPFIYTLF